MPSGISDLTRPIDLRRRALRRRRRIVLASILAAIVLIVAAVQVIGYSSLVAVRQVEVQGAGLASQAQIRAAAQVPEGTPLARVDLQQVGDRVAALPPVASVQVHRSWPHTITVQVTERTAVLQLRNGSHYLWVDAGGFVFHTSNRVDPKLPTALADQGNRRLLTELATTVGSLSATLRSQLDHIEAPGTDRIVLVLTGNRTVIWGNSSQSAAKSTVATAMLATRATVYDVSAPDHPTAR